MVCMYWADKYLYMPIIHAGRQKFKSGGEMFAAPAFIPFLLTAAGLYGILFVVSKS